MRFVLSDATEERYLKDMQYLWRQEAGVRIFTAPIFNLWGLGMYHLVNGLWHKSMLLETEEATRALIKECFPGAVMCTAENLPPVLEEVLHDKDTCFYRRFREQA